MSLCPPPVVLDSAACEWRTLSPGTRLALLQRLPNRGAITRIQGDPGSTFPEHIHHGGEAVYILAGDYTDATGTYTAGMYLTYEPNSQHQPHTVAGCDLLVIAWTGPPPA